MPELSKEIREETFNHNNNAEGMLFAVIPYKAKVGLIKCNKDELTKEMVVDAIEYLLKEYPKRLRMDLVYTYNEPHVGFVQYKTMFNRYKFLIRRSYIDELAEDMMNLLGLKRTIREEVKPEIKTRLSKNDREKIRECEEKYADVLEIPEDKNKDYNYEDIIVRKEVVKMKNKNESTGVVEKIRPDRFYLAALNKENGEVKERISLYGNLWLTDIVRLEKEEEKKKFTDTIYVLKDKYLMEDVFFIGENKRFNTVKLLQSIKDQKEKGNDIFNLVEDVSRLSVEYNNTRVYLFASDKISLNAVRRSILDTEIDITAKLIKGLQVDTSNIKFIGERYDSEAEEMYTEEVNLTFEEVQDASFATVMKILGIVQ